MGADRDIIMIVFVTPVFLLLRSPTWRKWFLERQKNRFFEIDKTSAGEIIRGHRYMKWI